MTLLPAITSLVAALFALVVLRQYAGHRKAYQLMWATGFTMFAIAAFAGFLARNGGTTDSAYRLFYLFGAILNVAWLALGTLYLLAPRRWADSGLVVVALLSIGAAYAVVSAPVDIAAASVPSGKGYLDGSLPRILAAGSSIAGSIILVGGALYSAWIFLQRRRNGRRAVANVIIAIGVFIVAAGGTATFTGAPGVLEAANLVGLAVMFAGFLLIV